MIIINSKFIIKLIKYYSSQTVIKKLGSIILLIRASRILKINQIRGNNYLIKITLLIYSKISKFYMMIQLIWKNRVFKNKIYFKIKKNHRMN
jgi:hypothetical protein